jgi:hypothetical protein
MQKKGARNQDCPRFVSGQVHEKNSSRQLPAQMPLTKLKTKGRQVGIIMLLPLFPAIIEPGALPA